MQQDDDAAQHRVTAGAAQAGERLDRLLAGTLPDMSRSRLKNLILEGRVRLGEATLRDPSHRVKPGQTFTISIPAAREAVPAGQAMALDIVYEDNDLIVVNKPAGLVVHPGPGNPDATLVNALIAHCGASLSGIGGVIRPGIVHRLDKDTSGLMVAAKNDTAHRVLSTAFAAHDIQRAYLAVVWGIPARPQGEISGNIGRHRTDRKRMAVVQRGGKPALTRYKLLRRFGRAASLLECRLATGRTHQIRVHLASIGHPVIGDPAYGRTSPARLAALEPDVRSAVRSFGRQALHAYLLGFAHPATGATFQWETKVPQDISDLIRNLESVK
jgi:23S rRNA pseudouridine1911/1915/1917 synthase